MEITQSSSQKTLQFKRDPPQQERNSIDQLAPFQALQTLAYLKIHHIIGDQKATPPVNGLIPMSRSKFYEGIKKGLHPAPYKSGRASFWRLEDIRVWLESIGR